MIKTVPVTGSTNADLAARLAAGERITEGYWLVADRQSAGKGRHGRTWFDGAGNFMGSTVIHVGRCDPPAGTLALVAALAVAEAVTSYLAPPHRVVLKWPNDVLVGNAKLAGILLEMVGGSVIAGIGVNLKAAPVLSDRDTATLAKFGAPPDRDLFAANLASHLDAEVARWRVYGLEAVLARWQALAHPAGTPLRIGEPGEETLHGTFAGLAADGALQLRLANGTTRTIHAGEVRLA
ncbi:biotin--[acetyl-CoA-carboxylase] ligase [Novosphingobium sp.]|uniref:biotin--[acetyl-CoA-carboxylase] ligase n=1 Tax=Novosphingobium sp. TaxID=1874826 RepID=UPI0025F64410|nr:biotin--[acetyl-CoA-carboxylase] ligase [Novosphingobium sp.]